LSCTRGAPTENTFPTRAVTRFTSFRLSRKSRKSR
jgi:hypothetical protein